MPSFRSQALFVLLLAGLVVLVERLIVTDEEAIRALGEAAAEAASTGDLERLEGLLSPDFRHEARDRAETVARIGSLLKRYKPTGIGLTLFDVRIEEGRATASAVVSATVYGRPVRQRVELVFERGDDGWRLQQAVGGRYPR